MSDLRPKIARLYGLGNGSIGPVQQFPICIFLHRIEKCICDADRVVRILSRNRIIGLRIPICVIGWEFDAGVTLLCVIQDAFDIGLRDCDFLCRFHRLFQRRIHFGIIGVGCRPIPRFNRGENQIELFFMHFGAGHDGGYFLLLDHLPVDKIFNIRVISITDHHFCRPAGGAAGFNSPCGPIANFQKSHQPGRLSAAREVLTGAAQRREVGPCARAVFEQTRFTHPKIHDPAVIH